MTSAYPAAGLRVELPVAGREIAVVGGGVAALGRIAALRAARQAMLVDDRVSNAAPEYAKATQAVAPAQLTASNSATES